MSLWRLALLVLLLLLSFSDEQVLQLLLSMLSLSSAYGSAAWLILSAYFRPVQSGRVEFEVGRKFELREESLPGHYRRLGIGLSARDDYAHEWFNLSVDHNCQPLRWPFRPRDTQTSIWSAAEL